jgi:methyl-accepting chemotaxis protein
MSSILEEFVVKLGFDVDEKKLDKFREGVSELGKSFLEFTGLASLASISIGGLFHHMQSGAVEIGQTSHLLGISSDRLQQWKQAADEAGSSGDSLVDAMNKANKSIGSIGTASPDIGFLTKNAFAGVNIGGIKTGEDYLLRISDTLNRIKDPNRKLSIASQLGLSDKDILFLELGSKRIRELVAEQKAIYNPDFIKRSNEARILLSQTRDEIDYLAASIFNDLSPAIKEVITNFKDWIEENKEVLNSGIKEFIIGLSTVVKFLAEHIKAVVIAFGVLYSARVIAGIASLITSFKTLNTVIGANPIFALVSAIGSLAYFGGQEITDSYKSDVTKAQNPLNFMSAGGLPNFGVANSLNSKALASSKSSPINNNVTVNVHTNASDPEAIVRISEQQFKKYMQNSAKDIYTNNKSQVKI